MRKLNGDKLQFHFFDVHPNAKLTVDFQRTLRIPDDGATYALPPGLGSFPIRKIAEFPRVPAAWKERQGVMIPLHQAEALWMKFNVAQTMNEPYPFAVKISAGKRSAVTGAPWAEGLSKGDYVVCPNQPWLDGFCTDTGKISQFVAAALGSGLSVEKQLSGEEVHGGLQIEVFPMKASEYEKRFGFGKRLRDMRRECNYGLSDCKRALQECEGNIRRAIEQLDGIHLTKGKADKGWVGGVHVGRRRSSRRKASLSTEPTLGFGKDPEFKGVVECCAGSAGAEAGAATMDWMEQEQYREYSSDTYGSQVKTRGLVTPKPDMSMAAGGNMTQKIHEDPYGIDVWDLEHSSRVFVHLTNSQAWEGITGEKCPSTPVTAALYKKYGYKWYTHEAPGKAVGPTPAMKTIKTGQEVAEEHGSPFLPENESFGIPAHEIVNLVKDGNW